VSTCRLYARVQLSLKCSSRWPILVPIVRHDSCAECPHRGAGPMCWERRWQTAYTTALPCSFNLGQRRNDCTLNCRLWDTTKKVISICNVSVLYSWGSHFESWRQQMLSTSRILLGFFSVPPYNIRDSTSWVTATHCHKLSSSSTYK